MGKTGCQVGWRRVLAGVAATGAALVVLAALSGAAAAADGSLDRVVRAGRLVVGIEGAYPPFNYFNEQNELEGFDVDISREIARRLGVEAEFVPTAWEGIVVGLLARRYDTIISSLAITPEREQRVSFTRPYYRSGAQLLVRADSALRGSDDLKGKRIGATSGTTFAEEAQRRGARVQLYEADYQAVQDLASRRLDGVVTDRVVALRFIREGKYPLRLAGQLMYEERMGLAVRKEDQALRQGLDRALEAMFSDGTYRQISLKWFGEDIR